MNRFRSLAALIPIAALVAVNGCSAEPKSLSVSCKEYLALFGEAGPSGQGMDDLEAAAPKWDPAVSKQVLGFVNVMRSGKGFDDAGKGPFTYINRLQEICGTYNNPRF